MKLTLLAFLLAGLLQAQQLQPVTSVQPDCQKFLSPIVIAGTFVSATVDNRQAACDGWTVTYSSFGFGTVSVLLQDAPLTTAGVAGTFVSYAGTIVTGFANPATSTTSAEIRAAGATTTGVYFPYVRVQITTTGAGILFAEFHGFKSNPNSGAGGGGSGSGCAGTAGTPCVVDGPTASGAAATKPPVMTAGIDDSGNVRTSATNPAGAVELAAGTGPDLGDQINFSTLSGIQVTGNTGTRFNTAFTVLSYLVDGTSFPSFNRPFQCSQRANVTLTTIGLTRIIPAIPNQFIHVCSLSLSFASPVDIQIVEGTQSVTACDTGATNMTGLFRSVTGFDPGWGMLLALGETAASDDVCISMSASVNGGGVATYAILNY